MTKYCENIYNNNLNYANKLFLKKRKKNSLIYSCIILVLLLIIVVIFLFQEKDEKLKNEKINNYFYENRIQLYLNETCLKTNPINKLVLTVDYENIGIKIFFKF